ncbi:thymidine kinase [Brachybacterium alimentarium]|uniref:thymidine kinase n=1 Tax=Brachybacterium alimentarium TaxID=47845 RepID=UPI000DF428AA|nr:thymidine kinase [Brachybacterium alimentarium]RCS74794.1 thymidine kinase [Brachybacterium alimentarium]RCS79240.1 thymidine kinase [Brachybacterium alimentarium]
MRPSTAGRLHVIAGPMFAGKTEELLRRVHRARLAGQQVEVFGHRLDDRGGADRLSTHIGRSEPARMLEHPQELLDALGGEKPDLVALDEAQFFGPGLVPVLDELLVGGIQVEAAGLCVTYDGGPFEPVPTLMAQAEEVVKLTAVCVVCGADAAFHVRRHDTPQEGDALQATAAQIGGTESYQARCRAHRHPGASPRRT